MKKQRIYLDTSVFGGYYDSEFDDYTKPLFKRIFQSEFIVLFSAVLQISAVLQKELSLAPNKVIGLISQLKSDYTEFVVESEIAVDLANEYISEKVVGMTNFADCMHIALATIYHADYLISWNFKHIVNVERIRGYNSINLKNGYKQIDIRTPRELMKYGK